MKKTQLCSGEDCYKEIDLDPLFVVTKLDGTAKGGVIIGIADQFKIPIRYIGVGEKAADLRAFESADFMHGLLES
jgi:signal recognition particle GTPase